MFKRVLGWARSLGPGPITILCIDAGSSSLKAAAYRVEGRASEPVRFLAVEQEAAKDGDAAIAALLERVTREGDALPSAIGHRLVFGGTKYVEPTLVSPEVLADLESLVTVEPLHLPAELDLVRAASRRLESVPQVLCFDTAFHRKAPPISHRLPLPPDIDPELQRYGFHGLSYEYVSSQLPPDSGRTIIAHLGSGASICALRDGVPVDTSMGFTALGGLMMGTRPGDLDPGVILRLLQNDGFDVATLSDFLYHRCGLLGVSGSTSDMKTLLESAASDARAAAAIELFVYQLVKHIGSMVAVLGGLDTFVFTGGIGEHAEPIRTQVVAKLGYLGAIRILVIPTDENLMIARHTARLTGASDLR